MLSWPAGDGFVELVSPEDQDAVDEDGYVETDAEPEPYTNGNEETYELE